MKSAFILAAVSAGLLSAAPAFSAPITLDFEGVNSFGSIANFYNGGTDVPATGVPASGTNYGVTFGGDALALANDSLGPYFSNAPSGNTVMGAVGSDAALNMASGFTDLMSFYYSATVDTTVNVYSGLNGTGTLLHTFYLATNAQSGCSDSPFCNWTLASTTLSGVAQSIQFGSAANVAAFDNVSITATPLPAAIWLLISGLGGVGALSRRRNAV